MADRDELLDHDYDGIREYDNDLPRWWLNIFWLTTIFAIAYAFYVHAGYSETPEAKLARELAKLEEKRAAPTSDVSPDAQGKSPSEVLLALANDADRVAAGEGIYATKCMACHGAKGEGTVGPNLTDDYWIHGGKITEIKQLIIDGVPAKGMLSWKNLMTPDEIDSVVAYVWNLHGSNPPNGKAPQGEMDPRE
jgi:cytochrome c oxidase cbb3-type subunit 3